MKTCGKILDIPVAKVNKQLTKNFTSFFTRFRVKCGNNSIWRIFFYQIKLYIFFLWMNSILWFCSSLWIFMNTDFFFLKKNWVLGEGFKEISVHFIRLNKLCADLRILIAKKNKGKKCPNFKEKENSFALVFNLWIILSQKWIVTVYEIKFMFFKKKNFPLKLQIRMDQYFDRLDKATRNEQLPVRIRFMIQDVIDMRRNKWQPRRIGKGKELQNFW